MITTAVLERAGVIFAAMLVALAMMDVVAERWTHRGIRFCFNLVILSGYLLTLQTLLR